MLAKKTQLTTVLISLILSSCATHPHSRAASQLPSERSQTSTASPERVPEKTGQTGQTTWQTTEPKTELPSGAQPNTPVSSVPTPAPNQAGPTRFAVWIDGAGFDAFAALGFLQELEKQGFKASKIVGTGFGCWIALSWALENRGTRAEWQSFKWSNFGSLEKQGLLGKLTGQMGSEDSLEAEVKRWLEVKDFSAFAIPADCPILSKKGSLRFQSGRSLPIPQLLWTELQFPALGSSDADISRGTWFSGVAGGAPFPEELDTFSQDIPNNSPDNHPFSGWVVLKTRSSQERAGASSWARGLAARSDDALSPNGKTSAGHTWMTVDLVENSERGMDEMKKAENRRRWLLSGRKKAHDLLQQNELKNFLGNSP